MALQESSLDSFTVERAAAALHSATRVAVLTGAGISAESGVPTFRDALTGLWSKFSPEDLATPEAFLRDPKLVWEWYESRRQLVRQVKPNEGHHALATLESRIAGFTLITQNVDGLHAAAGSRNLLELHGNILRNKRFDDGMPVNVGEWVPGSPPRCRETGQLIRPDVVWFGEMLPAEALESAFEAARTCEVFLCIGTSTVVAPASSLPFIALESGATVIEINPDETPLSGEATLVLRAIVAAL